MKHSILGLALFGSVAATGVMAQTQAQPAEYPPESYAGNQYIDSEGCAFIRAGISGITNWVPRMNRQREQMCGFQPSLAAAPAAPEVVPEVVTAEVAAPVVEETTPPEVAAVAEPVAPAATPVVPEVAQEAVAAAPASPAVIEVPRVAARPQVAAVPEVVEAPAPAAAQTRMSFAEACAGRTGVQAGMISSVTGQPIDCGSGAAEPRRVTLADICAEMAATGQSFINHATGAPVECSDGSTAVAATAAPGTVAAPAAPGTVAAPAAPGTVAATAAPVAVPDTPSGYAQIWDDGRVNTQRGLPETSGTATASAASAAQPAQTTVSTMSAPAVPVEHRYVQVGTYGVAENADRVARQLQAAGLPVGFATVMRNGQELRIVAAGPFGDAQALGSALAAVRSLGYGDAFTRR